MKLVQGVYCLCVPDTLREELKVWWPQAGMTSCGALWCISVWLVLRVLLCFTSVSWRGWDTLSKMTSNFDSILLSDTAGRDSSSTPTTSPSLRISLLSLLASATFSLLPQHATNSKQDSTGHHRLIKHAQQYEPLTVEQILLHKLFFSSYSCAVCSLTVWHTVRL